MNDQDLYAIGHTIDQFLFDTRRRLQQLKASCGMAEILSRRVNATIADAETRGDRGRTAERAGRENMIARKLTALANSELTGAIANLEKAVRDAELAVLGGSPTTGTFRQCVAVASASGRFTCSGVIIHRQWAVTSGHCTAPSRIFIGDKVIKGVMNDSLFNVIDAGEVGVGRGARLLQIDGEIHPEVPIAMVADHAKFAKNSPATIVGFGAAMPGGGGGVKRSGTVTIASDVDDVDLITVPPSADACFGDSGGPLIVEGANGEEVVYGLIDQALDGDCGNGTIHIKFDHDLVEAIEHAAGITLLKYVPPGGADEQARPRKARKPKR
jgi:hypothetical protein